MKTAVEWLIEQIENNVHHTIRIPREFFEQAKEMEKEQMHAEYMRGWKDGLTKKQEQ
jgi:hypothetical protein